MLSKVVDVVSNSNDMLGTTIGSKSNGKYSAAVLSAFGEGTDADKAFFTGKPMVEGLGHAFLMRNYRAGLAKWQSADPMGYPDGWNQLAYCNNGVINRIDADGCKYDTLVKSTDLKDYPILRQEITMWELALETKKVCTVEYSYDWVSIGAVESAGKTLLTYDMTSARTISRTDLQSKTEGIGRSIAAGIESSVGASLNVGVTGVESSIAASVSAAMSKSLEFGRSIAYTGETTVQHGQHGTMDVEDGYYGILEGYQLFVTIRYFEYYPNIVSSGLPQINNFGSIRIPLNNFGYRRFTYE